MASSVELRVPLVDYLFVEKVISFRKCNPDFKYGHKFLFKNSLSDSSSIVSCSWTVVIHKWLKESHIFFATSEDKVTARIIP